MPHRIQPIKHSQIYPVYLITLKYNILTKLILLHNNNLIKLI